MRIEQTQSRMVDLPDLLDEIHRGLVALPDFQRDFDWEPSDVVKLLVTVLKGWPAGSLLLMQGRARFFETRPFDGGPTPKKDSLRYTVLDGQQRLTSLYQAVYDRGLNVYAVETAALADGSVDALEEGVRSFKREEWDKRYRRRQWNRDGDWIPFYVLATPSDYFDWRDKIVASFVDDEEKLDVGAQLSSLYRDTLESVHRYKFPAVSVEADLDPSAISRIFERVNKTGQALSTFDLMVARVYERGWNLRTQWQEAQTNSSLIETFLSEDGMAVLQTIGLRHDQNVRESAILKLPQALIRGEWASSAEAVDQALIFLLRHCGVLRPDWLPYRALLLPIAALAHDHVLDEHRNTLRAWFFSRSFALAFDAAANTRVVSEYQHLQEVLRGDAELTVPSASFSTLLEASKRKRGAVWRAFLCVLADRNARDLSGSSLGIDEAQTELTLLGNDVVVAPVLERGVDTGPGSEPAHLRVLNLVLATRRTARRLDREYISTIVEEGAETDGKASVDAALSAQLLPPSDLVGELEGDWRAFLEYRLSALEEHVAQQIGQTIERAQPN